MISKKEDKMAKGFLRPIIRQRKGQATGMTMPKLITLILVVLVIAAVIGLGVSGQLAPLQERLGGGLDNAWLALSELFGGSSSTPTECNDRGFDTLKGGGELLTALGITDLNQREESKFKICDRECRVKLPKEEARSPQVDVSKGLYGTFRINEELRSSSSGRQVHPDLVSYQIRAFSPAWGAWSEDPNPEDHGFTYRDDFELSYGGGWSSYRFVLKSKDPEVARLYNDLYNNIYESFSVTEREIVKKFYDDQFTKRLIFHGNNDGAGDYHSFLIWQNGVWVHYRGRNVKGGEFGYKTRTIDLEPLTVRYLGDNAEDAINSFRDMVDDNWDDSVNWWWGPEFLPDNSAGAGNYQGVSIGEITGEDDELDSGREAGKIRAYVEPKVAAELRRVKPTAEEVEAFRQAIGEKTITWNNQEYTLIVGEQGELVVVNSNQESEYALQFSPAARARISGNGRAGGGFFVNHLSVELARYEKPKLWQEISIGSKIRVPQLYTDYGIVTDIDKQSSTRWKINYQAHDLAEGKLHSPYVIVNPQKEINTYENVSEDFWDNLEFGAYEGELKPLTDIHQDDIKLSREHFEEFAKIRLIKDFLELQCR